MPILKPEHFDEFKEMMSNREKIAIGDWGPSPIEDITTLEPENSPFMRKIKELNPMNDPFKRKIIEKEVENMKKDMSALRISDEYVKNLGKGCRTTGGISNFIEQTTISPQEVIDRHNPLDDELDAQRYAYIRVYNQKEEDKMPTMGMRANEPREPREMWSVYQVIAVEKSEVGLVEPTIDMKVIAKNKEHAAGLSGYNDLIEKYDYDNTKVKVNIQWLMEIRPVEDDG